MNRRWQGLIVAMGLGMAVGLTACERRDGQGQGTSPQSDASAVTGTTERGGEPAGRATGWVALFDGKSLAGWEVPRAGNEGDVKVVDGAIHLEAGENGTFIRYTKPVPQENYEITYEAIRIEGSDFFGALTFPVGKGFCTLVNGGWMNTTTGLSSVDGLDASMNMTTWSGMYENNRWYHFRVRVNRHAIQCWLDDQRIICQMRVLDDGIEHRPYEFDTRPEVDVCKPLGFATWWTHGAVRNIRLRRLSEQEADEKPKPLPGHF